MYYEYMCQLGGWGCKTFLKVVQNCWDHLGDVGERGNLEGISLGPYLCSLSAEQIRLSLKLSIFSLELGHLPVLMYVFFFLVFNLIDPSFSLFLDLLGSSFFLNLRSE